MREATQRANLVCPHEPQLQSCSVLHMAEQASEAQRANQEAQKHKRWHAKSAKDTDGFLKKVKKAGSDWVSEASASPSGLTQQQHGADKRDKVCRSL